MGQNLTLTFLKVENGTDLVQWGNEVRHELFSCGKVEGGGVSALKTWTHSRRETSLPSCSGSLGLLNCLPLPTHLQPTTLTCALMEASWRGYPTTEESALNPDWRFGKRLLREGDTWYGLRRGLSNSRGRVVGEWHPGRWRNVSSHGGGMTSSPMKTERSLVCLVFFWRQWETSGVFEQNGNMMSSMVWKINAAAMRGADSK